jgi:hypothetical protein
MPLPVVADHAMPGAFAGLRPPWIPMPLDGCGKTPECYSSNTEILQFAWPTAFG